MCHSEQQQLGEGNQWDPQLLGKGLIQKTQLCSGVNVSQSGYEAEHGDLAYIEEPGNMT